MMDPHELHYELIEYLGQFRRQVANAGTGDLSIKTSAEIGPVATKAHKQATALLATLQSAEFEELLP